MNSNRLFFKLLFTIIAICNFGFFSLSQAEERVKVLKNQIDILSKDLKTLEKAVYEKSNIVKKSVIAMALTKTFLQSIYLN